MTDIKTMDDIDDGDSDENEDDIYEQLKHLFNIAFTPLIALGIIPLNRSTFAWQKLVLWGVWLSYASRTL